MASELKQNANSSGVWWIITGVLALGTWILGGKSVKSEELARPSVRFEPSDINVRGVVLAVSGVLVFTLAITAVLYPVFEHFVHAREKESPPPLPEFTHGVVLPPEPRIQEFPKRDLQEWRAQQEFALQHYSVINQKNGTVAIPIDRAMDLIAQRGIPPQKAPAPNMFFEPRAGTRLTGLEGKVEPEPR